MSKLLREKYKTYDGARKRCGFENGLARSEFERGYKAHLYRYTVVEETETHYPEGGTYVTPKSVWRVRRERAEVQS